MRRNFLLILICFFVLIVYTQVYADVVRLKNGRQVEGEIIEDSTEVVKLKIKIGQIIFKRDEVASVEKKELPLNFFEDKIQVKSQPAKAELKAEGYQEVKPLKSNLDVKAEFKRLFDGDAILINGTTNLPPKTVLYLIFKTQTQQTVAVRKLFIEGSTFSDRIGPFGNKRVSPGVYIVEASFSPERQESEKIKDMLASAQEIIATSEITIGSLAEAEEKANKRKLELASQIKEFGYRYDELNREYEMQKKKFNEGSWNTWSLKWRSQLSAIKSSNEDYRNKTLVLHYPIQENLLTEIIYDLELLWNRYAAELFKMNNLTFEILPSNDTRDPESLKKVIQDRLKNSQDL